MSPSVRVLKGRCGGPGRQQAEGGGREGTHPPEFHLSEAGFSNGEEAGAPGAPRWRGILLSEQVGTGGTKNRDVHVSQTQPRQTAVLALELSAPSSLVSCEMTSEPPA